MKDDKGDSGGLTRRGFLYSSGVGMAGMTLVGGSRIGSWS